MASLKCSRYTVFCSINIEGQEFLKYLDNIDRNSKAYLIIWKLNHSELKHALRGIFILHLSFVKD